MNAQKIREIANKHISLLDDKKPQTSYKIKYVSTYVKEWLYVMANRPKTPMINFIDCMCNAGIYKDGDPGTSIKVLELFRDTAFGHQDRQFNIFLNDIDNNRLDVIKEVSNEILKTKPQNLTLHVANNDVNAYIENVGVFSTQCKPFGAATILFVDPYNFGSVKLRSLKTFIQEYYCELIFNVFTSDFVRNIQNDKNNKKIVESIGRDITNIKTVEQLVSLIKNELVIGDIKHAFAYEFRTQTNTELYQIIFFTPSIRGLEKLKEALWETFKGREFHRNEKQCETEQLSIWQETDEEQMVLDVCSRIAKEKVVKHFANIEVAYDEVKIFVLENTMLFEGQILNHVLKPLIKEKKVVKRNKEGKLNYKGDSFVIMGGVP
ncbi:MAG: three-Cys-motif partner protein TcmP [Chitinispirillales bacterium]|jgi:three-Cys-motif partner protein|nr:three-Cys-motif partner protein TcmP [Chitinispirillales bacterium]